MIIVGACMVVRLCSLGVIIEQIWRSKFDCNLGRIKDEYKGEEGNSLRAKTL